VSEDLTARVAKLTAQIGKRLDEDEAAAQRAESRDAQHEQHMPEAEMRKCVELASRRERNYDQPWWAANMRYQLDRSRLPSDPARERRRVKSTRDLVAAILAEGHQYVDGDPWFSCSQATEPGEDDRATADGTPGWPVCSASSRESGRVSGMDELPAKIAKITIHVDYMDGTAVEMQAVEPHDMAVDIAYPEPEYDFSNPAALVSLQPPPTITVRFTVNREHGWQERHMEDRADSREG
jgi:hypothetical protein